MAATGATKKCQDYEYTPINELSPGPSLSFYGRVVAFKPPTPTRGTDFMMSVTVVDDSIQPEFGDNSTGLVAIIFRPSESLFPDVRAEDDIIQFRHMRIQMFQGSLQALSTNWTAFTTFARNTQGEWVARPERPVGETERQVLNRISAQTGHTAAAIRQSPKKPMLGRPTLTIDLIQPNVFFDLVAKVVHILPTDHTSQISVLLADYTANLEIKTNPAHFDLSPDYEHRLLLTTFWDNFAERASQLKEGQIIRILNLRAKLVLSPIGGDYSSGGLIAVLHGDHSNSEKIFVLGSSNAEARIVQERKNALLGDIEHSPARHSPLKAAHQREGALFSHRDSTPTKVSRGHSPVRYASPTNPITLCSLTSNPSLNIPDYLAILHPEVPITAIKTVLEASDDLAKFVIKGRITRYQPSQIVDFCRRFCSKCRQSAPIKARACSSCASEHDEFMFRFALDVTDGCDSIRVIVVHQDATRFLNGLLPCDLASNPEVLDYLQDSMDRLVSFPIPSSLCIKSFCVSSQRRYRLFDTLLTIQ